MIRAVFFDIDGTLLSYTTHQMLQSTIEAVEAMRQKGIKMFISSGRPMVLIPHFPVEFDGYITVNGGYCFVGDTVVHRNAIDADDCERWLSYVEQQQITTMCFTDKEMYINRIDPVSAALRDQLGFEMPPLRPLSDMRGKEVYQFIAVQPAEKDAEVLSVLNRCRMPRWHPAFTDLIPYDSSKAVGIECLLSHFGIDREDSMAFGDGANDIEMLDYVGYGIAMGNASDIVKKHAKFTTDSADNDGIMRAIKKMKIIE